MQESVENVLYCEGLSGTDAWNLHGVADALTDYASKHPSVSVWLYGSSAYFVGSDQEVEFGDEAVTVETYNDIDLLVERSFSEMNREKIISHELSKVQDIVAELDDTFEVREDAFEQLESRGTLSLPSKSNDARPLEILQDINGTTFDIVFSRFDPGGTYDYEEPGDFPGRAHLLQE